VTESAATVRTTVPEVTLVPLSSTTYEDPLPVNDEIDQPVLVPESEISDCESPVTDSLNCKLYVSCEDEFEGVATVAAKEFTAGRNIVKTTRPLPEREPCVCVTLVANDGFA
jgi:hypothetical protein